MTAEKIIVGVEYSYHAALFLLVLRYPYKTLRQKQPTPSYIKMRDIVEREHPIFIMILVTFLCWTIPFIVTIPALGVAGEFMTPLIRNCALMLGAIILPILLVVRNSRICCSRHKACGVNDPHVCQCKGRSSNMCYACDMQHQDMLSKCELYSFSDRRKSLSLDDLKYVLGVYKNEISCSMKVHKKKLISRSFPIVNMDTIMEAELEDVSDIERLFSSSRGKCFDYSLEPSAQSKRGLSRESSLSLPLLPSPRKCNPNVKKIALHAKLSLSPRKPALMSPVRKSLEKKRAASLDNSKMDQIVSSPMSDRSTASSPIKSDDETKSLLGERKKKTKKDKALSKSKDSIRSKDSIKSKDSVKSKDSIKSRDNFKKKLAKSKLGIDLPIADSSLASPNRESRIPSFIPLADVDSPRKKTPGKITTPVKRSQGEKKEQKRKKSSEKSIDGEDAELLGEDPNRVPSRGPTFFVGGDVKNDDDDDGEDDVLKPLVDKEKKGKRRLKKKKKSDDKSLEGTPVHEVDGAPLGSLHSLEWDPSYSLSDSSCSSPIDEYQPPSPAPPPSNYALQKVKEMGVTAPNSPHASIGRSSNYSMDWDPTGVQMRHSLESPCDWEPYSVEEALSNPTSPDITDLQKIAVAQINRGRKTTSISPDKDRSGQAPLASEEI